MWENANSRRSAGHHYENHSTVVRNEAKGNCVHSFSTNITKGTQNAGRRRESVYILLVQMSPKALKMQENGDVNVSYK